MPVPPVQGGASKRADDLVVKKEGRYPRCPHCNMQVDPRVPTHVDNNKKECRIGTARHHQQDMAVRSALALRQQFT